MLNASIGLYFCGFLEVTINKADSKMYVEKESHKRTRMLHDYSKDKPQTDE